MPASPRQEEEEIAMLAPRKAFVATLIASTVLLFSACAMPADDPNFVDNAGGAGVAGGTGGVSGTGAAGDAVTAALAVPTSIGVDAPLSAKPAAGLLIVNVSDGSDESKVFSASMEEAATALGWTFKEVTGADTPENAPAAFQAALDLKPAAIHVEGLGTDVIGDGLTAAAAAGIKVVCTGCTAEPVEGMPEDIAIAGVQQYTDWGTLLASYVIANAGPDDANGEPFVEGIELPAVPAFVTFNAAFSTQLSALCNNCSLNENDMSINDPTGYADAAALAMQISNGRWALFDSAALSVGFEEALKANPPLVPTSIIGLSGGPENIKALVNKTQMAWTGYPIPIVAWRVVDQMARLIGGDAPSDGPVPTQLMTQENASTLVLGADGGYLGIADYQAQFKKLWGLG
jgi:ribose transport system substrate-binding protein